MPTHVIRYEYSLLLNVVAEGQSREYTRVLWDERSQMYRMSSMPTDGLDTERDSGSYDRSPVADRDVPMPDDGGVS